MRIIIEAGLVAFFLLINCIFLFYPSRLQRMATASWQKYTGSQYPMVVEVINSQAFSWIIRLSALTNVVISLVVVHLWISFHLE